MGYTCGEIVRAFRSSIKPSYERAEVNYAGKTADTGEYYTEVIASLFLDGEQLRLPLLRSTGTTAAAKGTNPRATKKNSALRASTVARRKSSNSGE